MINFFSEEEGPGMDKEKKIIYGSGGGGASGIIIGLLLYLLGLNQLGGILIILGLLIGIVPYGVISFLKGRHMKEMEQEFPLFLKGLAESKRGGMTLLDSFESAKETDYGRLNDEIERVYNELTWGVPFPKVMRRFADRMSDSAVMQQSLSIIIQSFESGGNITHTIESVAQDASKLREAVEQKNSKLKQQLLIMYVIYFLFIGITIGLYLILDQLVGFGESGGALSNLGGIIGSSSQQIQFCGGGSSIAQPFCTIAEIFGFVPDIDLASEQARNLKYGQMAYYKALLFTTLMVQGASTSAVAGKLSEGKAAAGIKHALIMLPMGFIAFMLIIAPSGV